MNGLRTWLVDSRQAPAAETELPRKGKVSSQNIVVSELLVCVKSGVTTICFINTMLLHQSLFKMCIRRRNPNLIEVSSHQ